jgi:hypothetical protein
MLQVKHQWSASALTIAGALAWSGLTAHANHPQDKPDDGRARTVFVVAMENHNWTQPASTTSPQPVFMDPDAHENVGGLPFASHIEFSHSSTLRTMQEIFDVDPASGYPWLGAAAAADDLSALFKHGTIH